MKTRLLDLSMQQKEREMVSKTDKTTKYFLLFRWFFLSCQVLCEGLPDACWQHGNTETPKKLHLEDFIEVVHWRDRKGGGRYREEGRQRE